MKVYTQNEVNELKKLQKQAAALAGNLKFGSSTEREQRLLKQAMRRYRRRNSVYMFASRNTKKELDKRDRINAKLAKLANK